VPQFCAERGLREAAFARQIESQLAFEGTVGVGYNSIRFDDEVTRHLLWRNLMDPYAREWRNHCGRWDLLGVVRAAYALRPDGIQWPRHEDGIPSFKLEHLTAVNGLAHEDAHDALSDVMATVALARLIKAAQPRLWDYCLRLRKKDAVLAEVGFGRPRPLIHISGMYPVARGCTAIVWPLGIHPVNKNELIVWDLSENPAVLQTLESSAMRERVFSTLSVRAAKGIERLPIKTIHINKAPIVISQLKVLDPHIASRWGIDVDQCLRHAEIAAQLQLSADLWTEVFAYPASSEPVDVDEDLYGGFISNGDRRLLDKLRSLAPEALATQAVRFEDPRLEELLFRFRARNFPESLNEAEAERWLQHRIERLHHGAGGGTPLAEYLNHLDQLHESADERGQAILGALYDYAEQIAPEL
jgi:exodeoxyribonuclease-1